MTSSQVEMARTLTAQGKHAEALILLANAATENPSDEVLWQEMALAASRNGQHLEAVHFCREAVKHHPRSDWLWRQLGHCLLTVGWLDEASDALEASWRLNPKAPFLWRYLADLHKARNDTDEEIAALEHLHTQRVASADDLIRLGNIYFTSKRDFGRAIHIYQRAAAVAPSAVAYFNLGLAFGNSEISQDLDAADAYRRALLMQADYAPAKAQLDATTKKLHALVQRSREQAEGLVPSDHRFQFYINPLSLLRLDSSIESDPDAARQIQRATKQLLHEIELNDGVVSWMENLVIDKSRALATVGDLHDATKLEFHAAIQRNELLERFLTHGDIRHFVHSDIHPLEELWDALDDDSSQFRRLLSKPFARQYDYVLSRAIEHRKLAVIEVLFDGRRWVEPEEQDMCFRGALQRVRAVVEEVERHKATNGTLPLASLPSWLDERAVVEVFNLLPAAFFRDEQIRLVAAIREMAVECWNTDSNPELSATLLNVCRQVRFKNAELNKRLEEDYGAVQRILSDTRQHSFSADLQRGVSGRITTAGIECNGVRLRPTEIESIRWGEYVRTVNGIESQHNFSIVARGQSRSVAIEWGKRSMFRAVGDMFRKRSGHTPIDELGINGQQEMFQKGVNAALHFLVPALLSKVSEQLHNDDSIAVGPCRLSRHGIVFQTGLFRSTDRLVPWSQAIVAIVSGQLTVADRRDRKARTAMSIMQTDNAVLLPMLVDIMKDGQTVVESDHATRNKEPSRAMPSASRRHLLGWLLAIGVAGIIAIALWANNSRPPSSGDAPPSWTAPIQPSYSAPSPPRPSAARDSTTFRVPANVSAELDRDKHTIDTAQAKAAQMEAELESLGRQLEQERVVLNRTSDSAVARFNQNVNRYNALLEELREQERAVNQMVDNYNTKLRRYGR